MICIFQAGSKADFQKTKSLMFQQYCEIHCENKSNKIEGEKKKTKLAKVDKIDTHKVNK